MNRKKWKVLCVTGILAIELISGCGGKKEAAAPTEQIEKEQSKDTGNKGKETAAGTDAEVKAKTDTEKNQQEAENGTAQSESKQGSITEKQESVFTISEKSYKDGDIQISYPYVENLVNQEVTDFYNHEFESAVAAYAGEAEEGDIAAGSQDAVQSFTVTYQSEEMISILIEGNFYSDGMPHAYSYSYSYNINLKSGASMGITDTFTPEEIADDIMAFRHISAVGDLESEDIKQELEVKGKEELLDQLNHCDFKFIAEKDGSISEGEEAPYSYSYRQEDGKWLIVMEGSHAAGDYFTLRYDR